MKTCGDCKELDCSGLDEHPSAPACDDFSGEAIEEEPIFPKPTPDDYNALVGIYNKALDEIIRLEARIAGYERAVAELVKWANGETP